ncbi:MAG: Ig-like domain-containing protein [Candidatus Marinimicrobia bacterium]|nr:Ig-like domain-containing protein [Candidatus Neomarinimicrobiota bacterium]
MKNINFRVFILSAIALLTFVGCDSRTPTEKDPDVIVYHLNLTSDRSVIYADNGKTVAKVTAILTNDVGEPQEGAIIVFSALSGAIASNIATNSSGQAEATFDDKGQAANNVNIVARYTDSNTNTVRDTVVINILPMEDLVSSFFATTTPNSGDVMVIKFDSSYSATINANVRDSLGVAVKNVLVNYRVLEGSTVGFLDAASDSTNALGTSHVSFTNNEGQIGTIVVEASVNSNMMRTLLEENPGVYDFGSLFKGAATSDVAFADTVTLNFRSAFDYTLRLNTFDRTIYADDGVTKARIYAIVKDFNNAGVDTLPVNFSCSVGIVGSPRFTDDTGLAETLFSDLGAHITEDVIALIVGSIEHPYYGTIRDTVEVQIRSENPNPPERTPALVELVSECVIIPNLDGSENCLTSSRLTATIMDSSGYPVEPNTLVRFTTDIGFVTQAAVTDEDGVAESYFTIGDSSGIATIFARAGNVRDSTLISVRTGLPSYIVIPPSNPSHIIVAGGFGLASTTIRAEIRDARGELVSDRYPVLFQLGPAIPAGANLDGSGTSTTVESNYGIASATLNSGTQSGPVRVTATILLPNSTISATAIPVTISAGPPAFMDVDIDISQIEPIGGGQYQAEMAARVWDRYTNPVEDSTQVYWHIEPDSIASVIGGTLTYAENLTSNKYHGLAWSLIYWNSDRTFDQVSVIAQTYGANGDTIQGYVNAAEDSLLLLPFYPGNLLVFPDRSFYDFQPAANPNPSQIGVVLTAVLTDYYNNAIKNARILFGSFGAAGWDPLDPDTGMPMVRTNNAGVAQITVFFDAQLCTPNFNADGTVNSYNPFTAQVWGTLLDPQSISSEQSSIQLVRSIQN